MNIITRQYYICLNCKTEITTKLETKLKRCPRCDCPLANMNEIEDRLIKLKKEEEDERRNNGTLNSD